MNNLRIGLIDDEEAPRLLLSEIISMIPGYTVSFSISDPFHCIELINQGSIDILITDVKMPEFGGFEISKTIEHLNIPIIICSAHDAFGVEGFKINAVHYILKPPSFLEVSEALKRARGIIEKIPFGLQEEKFVLLKEFGVLEKPLLRVSEILYVEQKDRFSHIHMESGKEYKTVNKLYVTLNNVKSPNMVRIHRSFAINFLKIKALEPTYCHLGSKVKIPIGREYREDFKKFMESKTII